MVSLKWYWLGFVASCGLLATAYFYFQLQLGLEACPLCMFQRACLVAFGLCCLLGIVIRPKKIGSKLIAFGATVFSALGLAIAGRQVWLQHLPADQVPECGPDLSFMLDAFPLMEVVETVLTGSGECAKVQWQLLGFSMPEWMVGIFLIMLLLSLRFLFAREKNYFRGAYR